MTLRRMYWGLRKKIWNIFSKINHTQRDSPENESRCSLWHLLNPSCDGEGLSKYHSEVALPVGLSVKLFVYQ